MRRPVAAVLALVVLGAWAPGAGAAAPSITLDRGSVAVRLGRSFSFTSTLAAGPGATGPLVAHLNVVSLDPSTYVDPEDWSTHRTRYLRPIAAGGSRAIRWSVKAVSAGPMAIYVTAVPAGGSGPIAVGPPLRVQVADRKTLNSGGVVPLALSVPAALVVLAVVARRRGAPG
ncbi:MAG TPA: hypothetical protein VLB81_08590 [Gaiellales bacterium]|nr:hypothetical protein [Gaiellales bacterium]